jgi:DNA (cytosine-5)-methyltransferase 1
VGRNVLIRDLSEDDIAWLDANTPLGCSRNEFLKELIAKSREPIPQFALFDPHAAVTETIAGVSPKFIDLFAGIGGFRIGMGAAGGTCVFTNEWDKYAQRTYSSWFGDDHLFAGDIRSQEVLQHIPDHDILCAGFPCQPFSIAGVSKKNSLGRLHGFEDEKQGNLFFAITSIIDEHRPPVALLENVKNLRSHDKGNTWRVIKSELERRDYVVFDKIIDAKGWVPQHRERIFIVCFDRKIFGNKEDIDFNFPEPPEQRPPVLGDVLEEEPESKYMLSDKLWKYLKDYRAKHEKKGNGFGYGLFDKTQTTRTLSARYYKDGSEILISQPGWRNPRRLTPREAMRLMGFTDSYAARFGFSDGFPIAVSDTQAYKQFGNAVVPLVIEAIGKEVLRVIATLYKNSGNGCVVKGRLSRAA